MRADCKQRALLRSAFMAVLDNPTRYQIHGSHQRKAISAFSARALPIAVISRSSVLLRPHICTQTFMYDHVENGVLKRGFIASNIRIFNPEYRPKIGKN